MTTWVDIFLWFPPSQNIIMCDRQASIQLNFSITCVFKVDKCFDSRSFCLISWNWDCANSQVVAASFIPLKLLFACSCCTPVCLSIAWDSKWKAAVFWATKKSWTTVKLRWDGSKQRSNNVELSHRSSMTQSLSLALFHRHLQSTVSRQSL